MRATMLWYVAFPADRAVEGRAWWQRFLHAGYRHVWCCRAEGPAHTLVLNHTGRLLDMALVPLPIGTFLRDRQAAGTPWILAVEPPPFQQRAQLRGPMTCVEAVKAAMGIHAPFVLTPRQLARHLAALGARPVLPIRA